MPKHRDVELSLVVGGGFLILVGMGLSNYVSTFKPQSNLLGIIGIACMAIGLAAIVVSICFEPEWPDDREP